MRAVLRLIFLTLGVVFTFASLLIPLSSQQIEKNKVMLAGMRDCVRGIEEFRNQFGRMPSDEDLKKIESSIPKRSELSYGFHFGAPPGDADRRYAEKPADGWMIWFWRGEWSEYYSSWDNHYSVEDGTSWTGFCGPLLFAPLLALVLFSLGIALKKRGLHS